MRVSRHKNWTEVSSILTKKDQPSNPIPIQNTLPTGMLLALVGGYLDAYTYLFRGGVFANAQTGNMVLLAISAAKGNFLKSFYYFIPIFAFFLGILVTEWLKSKVTIAGFAGWEHIVVLLEALLLLVVGFLPQRVPDAVINVTVSFVCSMQVNSFRKSGDLPYATTMCTGNLRSAAEHFFLALSRGDHEARRSCLQYFVIIFTFCAGAAAGCILTNLIGGKSVWVCCGLLALVLVRLSRPFK